MHYFDNQALKLGKKTKRFMFLLLAFLPTSSLHSQRQKANSQKHQNL